MHPGFGIDHFGGLRGIVPVAVHDRITAGAQLAGLAAGHGCAVRVDDLHFEMRLHLADAGHPFVQRCVGVALAADRAGLGHAVGDGDLGQVHLVHHPFHHLDGAWRAGHDAGAQAG